MELVLRTKEGKTPFIGVLFESEREAADTYAAMPSPGVFQLEVRPGRDTASLVLRNPRMSKTYHGVRFVPDELQNFIKDTRFNLRYKFGHVVMDKGRLKIVQATFFRVQWVVVVDKLTVGGEQTIS